LAVFSFTHLRWVWVILAIGFVYSTYWGRALRWAVFLKPLKPKPSMRNLLSATIVGFTAITLFGRPGEFIRPYLIATKEEVPLASQLAAWVLERLADLLMVLLLFGFALARVGTAGVAVGPRLALVLSAGGRIAASAGIVLVVLMVVFRHFSQPARRWIVGLFRFLPEPIRMQLDRAIAAFCRGVESTQSESALLLILLYSLLEWLLIVASYGCLAASFIGINLTIVDLFVFMGFVSLGASIQIPGIGGGVQVMAILVLTELFGVRLEAAAAFAFLTWLFTFVAVVPVGLMMSMKEGLEWGKLRRIRSGGHA
jgi:glycosyltransferase 2 family protein